MAALKEFSPFYHYETTPNILWFLPSNRTLLIWKHNLIWTTVKPLADLVEAQHDSVAALGTFLVACLSRTNRETAKLFLEGVVKGLQYACSGHRGKLARDFAAFALENLGICPVDSPQSSGTPINAGLPIEECSSDLYPILSPLGLSWFL